MSLSEKNEASPSSELEENLEILRQTYFFSGLPLEATKVFAYLCIREKFKSGEFLFQKDDEDEQAYYIISGSARLFHSGDGKELVIRDCEEGEFLGRLALMSTMSRLFSLRARTDMICLTITREKFTKALEQFPDLMPKLIRVIVENIYSWERRFVAHRTVDCIDCFKEIGVSLV
jgi:CRP-like cAMP-binding protein